MKEAFWNYALPLFLTGAFGGLAYLGKFLVSWAKAKYGSTRLGIVLVKVTAVVDSLVQHAQVELRPQIAKAMEDGTLSAEEAAQLKSEVMRMVKTALGEQGLGDLQGVLGLGSSMVDSFISGKIESAVKNLQVPDSPKV